MVDGGYKIAKTVFWAVVIFLGSAIIDSIINVWVFKKYGGCPMKDKNKGG